jgi:hypothetical protein
MAAYDNRKASGRAKPRRKKKVSPVRNAIGLVLVVSLSVVAYLEWDANRRSSACIRSLNEAMASEQGLLSMKQVEGILGRKPDGPGVTKGREVMFTYTWRGVFRKYTLVASYTGEFQLGLLRIE